MKKSTTLLMGTMVLGATLFANAAYANEAVQAHGWINMPAEDQWVVLPGSNATVTNQSGWINMPVEDQFVVQSSVTAQVTTQNGWIAMPVEDQTIILSPKSEQPTGVAHGWVAAPVEDSVIVVKPAASTNDTTQAHGWSWSVPYANNDK